MGQHDGGRDRQGEGALERLEGEKKREKNEGGEGEEGGGGG